ncbi:MAG: hypothetical protein EXS08_03740 [Planctomycetes bacterium]|nr:hypothetical protein [Planctomycetota bacterium]
MRVPPLLLLSSVCCLTAACADLRGSEGSRVSTTQNVASSYWFRGVPRSLQPVTQGDLVIDTPLAVGGNLTFTTWFNLQLTNKTGDAAFPDGLGGQVTEIDLALSYSRRVGRVDITWGGIGYSLPQVAPSTRETYLGLGLDAIGLTHMVTAYYDLDLLDDYYLQYQATRGFALDEHWNAALELMLGYMSDSQAEFYFGTKRSGFSDLLLTGSLTYAIDANTSLFFEAAGVTVPDDELSNSLRQSGLEDSGMWFTLGAAWGL